MTAKNGSLCRDKNKDKKVTGEIERSKIIAKLLDVQEDSVYGENFI